MPAERIEDVEEEGFEPTSSSALEREAAGRELEREEEPSGPVQVMTGTYFHALDEKGRVIIPAKLRGALTDQFWMMLDESDNLGLYSHATGMDILEHCERMMAEHPEDEDIAEAVYRITSRSDAVVVESGFRVPIPEILRLYAGLEKDVVTEGLLNHAVIWDRAKWEAERGADDRRSSPAVLKKQASILRAAASGKRLPARREEPREELIEAPGLERDDERIAGRDAGRGERVAERQSGRKAASSGDGGRSPRVLTLSQLGR